jgi:hypothetical protein
MPIEPDSRFILRVDNEREDRHKGGGDRQEHDAGGEDESA